MATLQAKNKADVVESIMAVVLILEATANVLLMFWLLLLEQSEAEDSSLRARSNRGGGVGGRWDSG